ncbi:MAG: phenylalanine--tRNA ligase subunit beta [Spirochaetales bacterium]|nr:phenylalanine--tRNA ligase subunit beta [Spirochaetales bacterium]
MPKIEVNRDIFFKQIGKKFTKDKLVEVLECAKGELDEVDEEHGVLKIELNDTNRPDLWSSVGLARAVRTWLTGERPAYKFFAAGKGKKATPKKRIIVDEKLKSIRSYIAAFVASGVKVDEAGLIDLIQTQEKLCGNYGRKRKSIAMGVYRSDIIAYPVNYTAADPDKTRFTPLGLEEEMSLREILARHPKGVEFGPIISGFKRFPYLKDAHGECLSLPPVINSAKLGAVEVGDASLFIELTGTDLNTLLLACSVVACNMADSGYEIEPVSVEYPFETPYGQTIVTPFYFQKPVSFRLSEAVRLLGDKIAASEALACLKRMGNSVKRGSAKPAPSGAEGLTTGGAKSADVFVLQPPPFRNDFMHPVDAIEEIMMGRGLGSFSPIQPEAFTVGRLSPREEFTRRAREIMVGLGYQEMIYNYLGAKADIVGKMKGDGTDLLEIANPMTENYEAVRNSILPNLLATEAGSANAVYPHRFFEAGRIARLDPSENYGSTTRVFLSLFVADRAADFNAVSADLSGLMYYLSREYVLEPLDDPRFIKGRSARIMVEKECVGVMGEVHPQVLEAWGVQTPCVAAEIDLDLLRA